MSDDVFGLRSEKWQDRSTGTSAPAPTLPTGCDDTTLASRLQRSMDYRGLSFTQNNCPPAPWRARESAISKPAVDAMNLTDCLANERSPRRQVAGSNPVTPIKMSDDVFGLRSEKRQDRPTICWLLRRPCRQVATTQRWRVACNEAWITVDSHLRRTIAHPRHGLRARTLFQNRPWTR